MTGRSGLAVALLVLLASGCMGYRDYYDTASDRYDEALAGARPATTDRRARCTVHVRRYLARTLEEPVSVERTELERMAEESIRQMQIFKPDRLGRNVERPDYHFIFDVTIETTREPGLFAGLILPFDRGREYTVRLQVLDERGKPFTRYAAAAGTRQFRHLFLLPVAPFYWPGWAERRAMRDLFRALTVKLIEHRKEYL